MLLNTTSNIFSNYTRFTIKIDKNRPTFVKTTVVILLPVVEMETSQISNHISKNIKDSPPLILA